MELRHQPGQILNEIELARELNVSRTPVREALIRLSMENLVTMNKGSSARVSEINIRDFQKLIEYRLILERGAARLTAANATDSHIRKLEDLQERINAMKEIHLPDMIDLDGQFHRILRDATDNPILIRSMTVVMNQFSILLRQISYRSKEFLSCLPQVIEALKKNDEDFCHYEIPVAELLAAAGLTTVGGQVYRDLARLTRKVMSRVVEIKEERSWTQYTLFSKCAYTRGDKKLIVRFDPDLKPHYLELKRHFTTYSLAEFLSLPSIYSQRIYEILRSWDDCVATEIKIADLHEMLKTPPSFRKTFGIFRHRVLEKAHKDINSLTQLKYEWEAVTASGAPLKRGRKVAAVRFVMGKKTRAKTRAKKRKETNEKQSAGNNRLFMKAVRCAAGQPGR